MYKNFTSILQIAYGFNTIPLLINLGQFRPQLAVHCHPDRVGQVEEAFHHQQAESKEAAEAGVAADHFERIMDLLKMGTKWQWPHLLSTLIRERGCANYLKEK
jgi:hypothetical protein